jgi:hypothetical protein
MTLGHVLILSESDAKDQELLVRAACSVVLQREVSLSRRVYTWLLSKEESPEKQVAYFRSYGLELLSQVLKVCRSHIAPDAKTDEMIGRHEQLGRRDPVIRCTATVQGLFVTVGQVGNRGIAQ